MASLELSELGLEHRWTRSCACGAFLVGLSSEAAAA